jgi:IPTL-CTERM motif
VGHAEIGLGTVWGSGPILTTEVGIGLNSDEEFPFELALCGLNDGNINFNPPQPDGWKQEINEKCLSGDCQTGVWSRLAEDGNNAVFFSWTNVAFGDCNILPFSGVDTESPIINHSCVSGFGTILTAPSIITEANSAVIRSFVLNESTGAIPFGNLGQFFGSASSNQTDFSFFGVIDTQLLAGDTGTEVYTDFFPPAQWHACTIALRMDVPEPRPIPTLSEWGLIAMAGLIGVIGLLALKRRKVAA